MIKLATTTAYTIKEAAEIMGKSVPTIRNYIKTGELRAQKAGIEYRWIQYTKTGAPSAETARKIIREYYMGGAA